MDIIDEAAPPHLMTYLEREALKAFARNGHSLDQALLMIAHWMRTGQDVTFSGYAANWAVANESDPRGPLKAKWPLTAPRMIADGSSEWGSYLRRI